MSTLTIYVNQVGFDRRSPKTAIVGVEAPLPAGTTFTLIDTAHGGAAVFTGTLGPGEAIEEWAPGRVFYRADFSGFQTAGEYAVVVTEGGKAERSPAFRIDDHGLAREVIPAIVGFYRKQRANTPQELEADKKLRVKGSRHTVDMHGGWCDASGDVSKMFSHLSYANFMSPQQTPLVVWSLAAARAAIPHQLARWGVADALDSEGLWGADYLMRALSPEGFFYAIVFSYFKPDPSEREVVGLLADSVTTADYQAAYREGGGMAIAALARVSGWKKSGDYTSAQYLAAAERAFAHLQIHNKEYDDDGKENVIDDYCALLAATELWIATDRPVYRDEARKRAHHLAERMTPAGYFRANDTDRPFWHASDAGLPIVALARYLDKEADPAERKGALDTIRRALDYHLKITGDASNPFRYPRQTFLFRGKRQEGFFIPHENESGWWWQGENARLGSLATAAIVGGRLAYPGDGPWGVRPDLAAFAEQNLSWVLGCNPYSMCFLYGFGVKNVPHMNALYGHGTERGGISNGITGKDGAADGTGIDFKEEAEGNEWRWTEQWIPHAAWFLQAVSAMAETEPAAK